MPRQMHRLLPITALTLVLVAGVLAPKAMAQNSASDLRAQYVADLETMKSKFTELAGAMDASMYGWQPMEGVRTVSEVYMLIVAENYGIPSNWGAAAPAGVTPSPTMFRDLAKVTDKADVTKQLEDSFTYMIDAVSKLSDAKMSETIKMFGQDRTVQAALFMIVGDMHEHLGQAIAYARSNKVVPPWTARRQQQM